jgi:methylmalonyl-CoA epimerase
MKVSLDHIGIAVGDLEAALRFYRDALGLEVSGSEEVAIQRVRAHFLMLGDSTGADSEDARAALELLEATGPDSPIAKFVDKRGPGLHHITLSVDDIRATMARVSARGAKLIDEHPRIGAEGALVAFVHPSSTHGVLIELKQSASGGRRPAVEDQTIRRFVLGDLELVSLYDGFFRLDGGSMFGTVPRSLWSSQVTPDARHRIPLAMRPLVVRGARTMLVDAGIGDKEHEKFCDIYGVERGRNLDHALAEAGLGPEDIDLVLATHLHFDHAGGFTIRDAAGRVRPRFPRARYVVRRGEWDDATHPHERNRASYLPDNFQPLAEAGVLELVSDDQTIMPGVRVRRTGGHTDHHQIVVIDSGGQQAAFVADLMPTTAHLPPAWIMGFDLFPMETLTAKKNFIREAVDRHTLVFFEHDPRLAAGYIQLENGKPRILGTVGSHGARDGHDESL